MKKKGGNTKDKEVQIRQVEKGFFLLEKATGGLETVATVLEGTEEEALKKSKELKRKKIRHVNI